ncbi:MAG TPA: efflux RND transporter permease subunit [Saprospiraceae bacterium]|nr:efflux RND transporter permease subunit [Saprospiraceae bacterium]HNT20922.1 efflux RND transporter permease subunit [Saprospiraceae bacterium]
MNLIVAALKKPVTVLVLVLAMILSSVLSLKKVPLDMFPDLGLPTIYISQPYGGLSPEQMEGFVTSNLEYYCIYLTGLAYVESKSVQNYALIKLQFHPGTNMNQAMAEVVNNVNRAKSKMPEGTVPPFIVRYDAGSVPVGQLVFSSENHSLTEIQDLALFKVRPMFSSLEGVSAPPPFGGNQKAIIVKVNPEKMTSLGISPDEVVDAIAAGNMVTPAGNIRIGDENLITPINSVAGNIKDLENLVVKKGDRFMAFIRDVATVQNGSDLTTGYALINGRRSVYIPVSKRSDASSWQVVQNVKKALPAMQAAVPDDIRVTYEFDQTEYLIKSLKSLLTEALLGALLTGLMVLFFLKDLRSAFIVVLTIPLALLGAVTGLSITGQTLNLMTLGGLALAVGILVDEATVTVENIHRHQESGKPKRRAILEASLEISFPKLLILLCILMVFVPSFFMSGLPKAMFQPLAMAVGFAMIISFLLSQTFVPVISAWLLNNRLSQHHNGKAFRMQQKYRERIAGWMAWKRPITITYFLILALSLVGLFASIGTEIFPRADGGQFQFRLRLKPGTRMERTEEATRKALMRIETLAGRENVEITSAFVGAQPSSFPNNTIYLWTNGPYEAVVQVKLNSASGVSLADLREKIRDDFSKNMQDVSISFEPADLVERVMSLGSTTPIDIAVLGRNMEQSKAIAESLMVKLTTLTYLRDLQIGIPLDYPSLKIDIDRERVGLMGLTIEDINNAIVTATSSSRFVSPVYWLDQESGNTYQIQAEFPQNQMNSIESLENIPLGKEGMRILLRDVARIFPASSYGVYQRYNQQRMVNVTANLEEKDFGSAMKEIDDILNTLELQPGTTILKKGQSLVLDQTLSELKNGLLVALVAIFLLMAANFQSLRIGFVILLSASASIVGALLLLTLANQTLNIQSFTGTVMALGVSFANGILMINAAEGFRKMGLSPENSISEAAGTRLRPILMTAVAMIAGMIPLSVGMGETGKQIVPLGLAVIGGLTLSTIITLWILPSIYGSFMTGVGNHSISLLPGDEQ